MIFVDTGAWIAIYKRNDLHHREAMAIYNNLRDQETQLLTTDYVISG